MDKLNKKKYDRKYYLNIKRKKYYKEKYNIIIDNKIIVKIEHGTFIIYL
jgi:hypothetical protein